MKKKISLLIFATVIGFRGMLHAAVPVAVLPIKGESPHKNELESKIITVLPGRGNIGIVAKGMLKEIVKLHEKAQTLGSDYHDISKLKVAEYIVIGNLSTVQVQIKAVDVNSGVEVYNKSYNFNSFNRTYTFNRASTELRDAISIHASSKIRKIPEEAQAYMSLLKNFGASLGMGDAAAYPYIALYHKGSYKHPNSKDKEFVKKASRFIKVIRPNLVRAKLHFMGIESKSPWVYIFIISSKLGKKTKHKFGIIELDDGSLGIGLYDFLR